MAEIQIYCKCELESCGIIFPVEKRRRYCTPAHRHAAYYLRKKLRLSQGEEDD